MKRAATVSFLIAILALTACSGLGNFLPPAASATPAAATSTARPTQVPPTATLRPPTATSEPATPTVTPDLSWITEAPAAEIEYRMPLTLRHLTDRSAVFQYALSQEVPAQLLLWRHRDGGDLRRIELDQAEAIVEVGELRPETEYRSALLVGDESQARPTLLGEPWPILEWRTAGSGISGLKVAVLGDSGFGDVVTRALAEQIQAREANFSLHTGDVVYRVHENDDPPTAYQIKLYQTHQPILTSMPLYPVPGNHEYDAAARWRGIPYYFEAFAPVQAAGITYPPDSDGAWYAFHYGDVQFLMLNSQSIFGQPGAAEQRAWLAERIADETYRYSVAVLHIPLYNLGRHQNSADIVRSRWGDLLIDERVPLVLAGHDHNYQRWQVGPTTEIVSGGASAVLYGVEGEDPQLEVGARRSHFVLLEFSRNSIQLKAIDETGQVFDEATVVVP